MRSLSDLKTKAVVSNIRKTREIKNYTQDYLAAKLKISQNAYSKIELGYSNITLSRLIEISEILEVDLTELINFGLSQMSLQDRFRETLLKA
jgi:transcriptional regulator with XRE-family HTH domain